jgi:sugar phosphate isomerase/epimerase
MRKEARMTAISRREFFQKSAAGAAATGLISAAGQRLQANPLGLPIGSQAYPFQTRIRDGELAGLCKDLAGIGVGLIELCSPGYPAFATLKDGKQTRKIIEDQGLKCPSAHFLMPELRNQQDEAIAWAKDVGITQMGTASLSPQLSGPPTMDDVKRAADEYNKIGEKAAKAGLVQFLHDEAFELARVNGRLVYEMLFELLDPKLVKMQFQMSAMTTVGDPVTYFNKYPGRFISIHLQGVGPVPPPAAAPPVVPTAPPAAQGQAGRGGRGGGRAPQLPLGKDTVDWPKVFAAAKAGGVKNYFVEHEGANGWDTTVQSVAYLKTLNG